MEAKGPRELLLLSGLLSLSAALFWVIGLSAPNWTRFVGYGAAFVIASLATDLVLQLLPKSKPREWVRAIVALPAEILMLLVRIAMALWTPLFIVAGLLAIILAGLTAVVGTFAQVEPLNWALLYVSLVITVVIAAYSGDRLLLPLRWYFRIEGREVDKRLFRDSQRALSVINFRRLGYLLTILAYSLSACVDLAGIPVPQAARPVLDTATAALLGFLAVDAYVSAFHPWLLAPRAPLVFQPAPESEIDTPSPQINRS